MFMSGDSAASEHIKLALASLACEASKRVFIEVLKAFFQRGVHSEVRLLNDS